MYKHSFDLQSKDFLTTAYTLMLKKISRLVEIEKLKKRNKLPLPLLKEKFEETSKILESLNILIDSIDYNKKEGSELADILNDIGLNLSRANIAENTEEALYRYNICAVILDSFLNEP